MSADEYFAKQHPHMDTLLALRKILLRTELDEEIKWGGPSYSLNGKILIGLGGYKHHVALWFHQGALLSDPDQVLINAQDGKTQAMRQWRLEKPTDIKARKIKSYIEETIKLAKQGKEIKPRRMVPWSIPDELAQVLANNKGFKQAFAKLTPGRQREYAEYIGDAKQAATKQRRLEKILPLVQQGVGLHDKYRPK